MMDDKWMLRSIAIFGIILLLSGCSASREIIPSPSHLNSPLPTTAALVTTIPAPVAVTPILPAPMALPKQELYTVVVNDVPAKELLFSLARDSEINIDVHPGVTGKITMNAVDQTLTQILHRITEQLPIRYQVAGNFIAISPDTPFFREYKIDYINMERKSKSTVSVATRIATVGGGISSGGGGGGGSGSRSGNVSKTTVESESKNAFWETLFDNLESLLKQTDIENNKNKGSSRKTENTDGKKSGRIIANPLSGIITVYANQRQQKQVQIFLDKVMANIQRQVLIEATIVEIELSDRYQAGVDWNIVSAKGDNALSLISDMNGGNLETTPAFLLGLTRTTSDTKIGAAISMLETFGNVKVLSSPKIIALNNQAALLKVVDEKVYFEILLEEKIDQVTNLTTRTFSSEINTVPVGLIMSVTPQVNENGNVLMNIRPTITRITGFAVDPTPRLQNANFDNLVPEIQVREMETLLQVADGHTVVLGGLMQDKEDRKTRGIPLLSGIPFIGSLFSYRDDKTIKTELVIFLKPTVMQAHSDADMTVGHFTSDAF
ncbi:MAG: pilus (MSHA type) biogenesis protein MshL [Gammaproteobacteria bacterium]|nr:pilus (MSHA type) biogenesis protein MshL [Gammaproteobacteria bacterium]